MGGVDPQASPATVGQKFDPSTDAWLRKHLNPCGEMSTLKGAAKIPDGAVTQSVLSELREALIIRPPGLTESSSLPLDGSNWTLTIVQFPQALTSAWLIANMTRAEMSIGDRNLVLNYMNATALPATYPNWATLTDGELYLCRVEWKTFSNILASNDLSALVTSARITALGTTIFFNTPTLVDQGMLIAGQWNADAQTVQSIAVDVVSSSETLTLAVTSYLAPTATTVGDFAITVTSSVAGAGNPVTTAFVLNFEANTATASLELPELPSGFTRGDVGLPGATNPIATNGALSIGVTYDAPTYYMNVTGNGSSVRTLPISPTSTDALQAAITSPGEVLYQSLLLPPTDMQNIIQSDPKAVYYVLKEEMGCYVVSRLWQPVLSMAEAANYVVQHYRDDKRDVPSATSVAGFSDLVDLNYGCSVIILSGISRSCCPGFKCFKDWEAVAAAGSPWMLQMTEAPQRDELAVEIARDIAIKHPHAYPESYNSLGGLMDILSGVLSHVPIIGQAIPLVKGAISLLGGQRKESPSSQNVMANPATTDPASIVAQITRLLGGGQVGSG